MESKELTVVIVTFKSENKIFSCLDSIPSNISIFVVENSKNENFRTNIESKYPNVKCILTGENKGYSVANNIGLSKVKTKYALILNPDTIVSNNAIKNFFISANNNKDFWLMGPANNYLENDNSNLNKIFEVKNLKGFAIFFNLEKFNKKFFDENFFLYFEEIDLCKNVDTLGGKILMNRSIIINHEGGSSVKKNNLIELEKNRNWHWMWSTFYYHKKFSNFYLAFLKVFPKLTSSLFKTVFYYLILNNEKKSIYQCRLNGLINSICGKKSWYRPSLD